MTLSAHTPEVAGWLTEHGWFPGRDIGPRADELIQVRVDDATRQGWQLAPLETAVRFVHEYGDLELRSPRKSPDVVLTIKPTGGYEGDVEDFAELGEGLGVRLFPVAYETYERGIWLVDETGRFFYWHHTGGYFLGENEYEAFAAAMSGRLLPDAEDYFV
ncbi:SUKH-3 domain-containing protein [Streptomyces sp. NPDC049555]|uniref:SUKH-3 domain-containing protein n=1 Tax=Streptomyces sp. NPDC049555 TaxID=3154930 RepID=UPI0034488EA2